jgi:hypothetical protein
MSHLSGRHRIMGAIGCPITLVMTVLEAACHSRRTSGIASTIADAPRGRQGSDDDLSGWSWFVEEKQRKKARKISVQTKHGPF